MSVGDRTCLQLTLGAAGNDICSIVGGCGQGSPRGDLLLFPVSAGRGEGKVLLPQFWLLRAASFGPLVPEEGAELSTLRPVPAHFWVRHPRGEMA